jgi:lipoprotein signal peptidase
MDNAKTAKKKFPLKDWKFIQRLKNAWTANRFIFGIISITIILALDQIIDYLVLNKHFFSIEKIVCNPGFSLGFSLNQVWFWFFWVTALLFLLFLIKKHPHFFLILALTGALANLIDRLIFGCVVDYIAIWHFPVFNLADFLISAGFIGFIIFNQKKS